MADIRYTKEHEWVRLEDDGTTTIGITDHAQEALGDVVFIELPEPDRDLAEGESCAVVESVKAASDVFAPFAGKVLEVNEVLAEDSSLVNRDAEGEAWFFRMEPTDPEAFNGLMEEAEYTAYLETL
ncbi:glycine cleavage system protein GcvH [Lichenicoccus roseus]|uniref:Glycine cleavage system H protein n=1 Tax=Lichenicoccus roseus TaxID=2683649 RepID=A0A5R9J3W2_9PROT|nr:glycine cleavage system protein GcvH [Lichenicoccus roseus]TLU72232.1 glycine cleavage system protein GcvH [Lichenicoccus roseus]